MTEFNDKSCCMILRNKYVSWLSNIDGILSIWWRLLKLIAWRYWRGVYASWAWYRYLVKAFDSNGNTLRKSLASLPRTYLSTHWVTKIYEVSVSSDSKRKPLIVKKSKIPNHCARDEICCNLLSDIWSYLWQAWPAFWCWKLWFSASVRSCWSRLPNTL